MTSINTNTSAMTALVTLQNTNAMMETTQNRISTGLRISSAADNAAYWSISATMKSDNSALSTVKDALGLGAATVDVAYTAMESATSLVTEIKSKLVAARQPGVDRAKVQNEIGQLQEQLRSVSNSASFSGENWLAVDSSATGYSSDRDIVSSFSRAPDGTVTTGLIKIDIDDFKLTDGTLIAAANDDRGILDKETGATQNGTAGDPNAKSTGTYAAGLTSGKSVLNFTISATTLDADMDVLIQEISTAEQSMITQTASLGSARNRINLQNDFVTSLMDAIDRGVGQLVDADMTEESSKLKALQVQQQLGIQSLSIANANAQNILALFR